MILHTERLENPHGSCEVVRTLSVYGEHRELFDLIADEGYDEEKNSPLCVILDDGNNFKITFDPYNLTGYRQKIKIDYCYADYLRKLLVYIEKRIAEKEKKT